MSGSGDAVTATGAVQESGQQRTGLVKLASGKEGAARCVRRGVGEAVQRGWVQQLQMERQQGTAITPDQQRIQELEARIERLKRGRASLKKGTAPLMSEGIERTK
jgi:transposase